MVLLAFISVVGPTSRPAGAQSSDAGAYLSKINALRASVGAAPLQLDGNLSSLAQGWAQHLADQGALSHAGDLSTGVSGSWAKLGENVGLGPDTNTIFNAFVNSSGHYANLVDPAFTHIGIGIVWVGPMQYTAHRFLASPGGGGGDAGGADWGTDTGGGDAGWVDPGGGAEASAASTGTSGADAEQLAPAEAPAPEPEPVTPPPATAERVGAIVAAFRAIPS